MPVAQANDRTSLL